MRRLYLVRHGATQGGEGLAVGQTDLALSPAGVREMKALAASWRGPAPDRLVASDLSRASICASLLATQLGGFPTFDSRLREIFFGDWEGRPWDEIHREDPGRLADWGSRWWEIAPPGGETYADLKRRVLAWFGDLRALAEAETVIAVAHGGSLRALLAALLGVPDSQAFDVQIDYAHVSAVDWTGEGWEVRFVNQGGFAPP